MQVVVRCRPMSNKEAAGNFQRVVDVYPTRGVIDILNPNESTKENKKTFTYDAVYDWKYVINYLFCLKLKTLIEKYLFNILVPLNKMSMMK